MIMSSVGPSPTMLVMPGVFHVRESVAAECTTGTRDMEREAAVSLARGPVPFAPDSGIPLGEPQGQI